MHGRLFSSERQNITTRSDFNAIAVQVVKKNGNDAAKLLNRIESYLGKLNQESFQTNFPALIRELKGIRSSEFGSDKSVQCEKVLWVLLKKHDGFSFDIDDTDDLIEPEHATILERIKPSWFPKKKQPLGLVK